MDEQSISLVWEITRTAGGTGGLIALVVLFGRWVFGRRAAHQQQAPDVPAEPQRPPHDWLPPSLLEEQAAKAMELISIETARADRYFRCIETVERERNDWHQAYEVASTGHANAQSMMLDEIVRLGRRLERARAALQRDPPDVPAALASLAVEPKKGLAEIAEKYRQEHGPEGIPGQIQPAKLDLTAPETEARVSGGRRA